MERIALIIAMLGSFFAAPDPGSPGVSGIPAAPAESPRPTAAPSTQPAEGATRPSPEKPATATPAPPVKLETTAEAATTQPTTAAAPPDAATDAALTRFEEANAKLKSLTAKLRYDRFQGLLGDRQRRFGTLSYLAPAIGAGKDSPSSPRKFRIDFDTLLVEKRKDKLDQSFVFDGVWLVERDGSQKTFIKRQVVAPGTPPEKADPLAMGEGPFPLPMSAKKADILRKFTAAMVEPAKDDPAHSVHLQLTPRAGQRMSYTRVDLWCDKETMSLVRLATEDESENKSVIEITDRKLDATIDPVVFDTSEPKEDGWRVEVKPWEGK